MATDVQEDLDRSALVTKVRAVIAEEFWTHPVNMHSRCEPGTNMGPVFDCMAEAVVDALAAGLGQP